MMAQSRKGTIMNTDEATLVLQTKPGHPFETVTTVGSVWLVHEAIAGLRARPNPGRYRAAIVVCQYDDDGHQTGAEITVYDLADPIPMGTRTIAVDGWIDREMAARDALAELDD
jgi:hypothetical protein